MNIYLNAQGIKLMCYYTMKFHINYLYNLIMFCYG